MKFSLSLAIASLASTVSAHGGVLSYTIAGTKYNGFQPYNSPSNQPSSIQREWDTFNPIQDPSQSAMRCNTNGAVAKLSATVAAGSKIVSTWNQWSHNIGPMVTWMANCGGSCANYDGSGAKWFKIGQSGLINGTLSKGTWGSGVMIAQGSTWTDTIPASLPAGNYLFRTEMLALHTSNAPQWYPECAHFTVTGSGTKAPSSTYLASIPGVYSMSDPNVNIDVYSNANSGVTKYTIPGPAVWTG